MNVRQSVQIMAVSEQATASGQRRGIAILWLILLVPVCLLLLCMGIEAGNLWLARAELEAALESAALASVKQWADAGGGSTAVPRQVGQSVALANRVRNIPLMIDQNYTALGPNNENTDITFPPTTANLIFGSITSTSPTVVFNPITPPDPNCMNNLPFAVRAEAIAEVSPICGGFGGGLWGPFEVRAHTTAYFNCSTQLPAIIRVGL